MLFSFILKIFYFLQAFVSVTKDLSPGALKIVFPLPPIKSVRGWSHQVDKFSKYNPDTIDICTNRYLTYLWKSRKYGS